MALCTKYGFDSDYTVVIKGVRADINLSTVKKMFASLDDVAKIQHIDDLSNTILCQFTEQVTPMIVEGTFSNEDGSQWEIVLVGDFCTESKDGSEPTDNVVPLARIIDDMTAAFQEQISELAITYNVHPTTLSQSAANYMCGKVDANKSHVTSTPAHRHKLQPHVDFLSEPTDATAHVLGQVQSPDGDSSLTIPVPADVQRVVVEHIVKRDSHVYAPTVKESRPFSGNFPKSPSEVDYRSWRLRAKQVLDDSTLSEGQQRRALLDSLHSPALNVALGIGPQAPPHVYLRELDNAYGNVTGAEELYIQFLETHQNSGETASDYLRRLQALLQEILERDGVCKQDAGSQLLKQFLRGCWDDNLIIALHLKELFSNPFNVIPTFSELLLKIRTHEKESQLKEVRRKRHMGITSTKIHTKTLVSMGESEAPSHKVSKVPDAATREQLEERIRQLEAELRENASSQIAQRSRPVKEEQRTTNKSKNFNKNQSAPPQPTERRMKFMKFCYQCGEDSHMLSQCSNPPNAVLVQRKLCERHNSRQVKQPVAPQSDLPLNM